MRPARRTPGSWTVTARKARRLRSTIMRFPAAPTPDRAADVFKRYNPVSTPLCARATRAASGTSTSCALAPECASRLAATDSAVCVIDRPACCRQSCSHVAISDAAACTQTAQDRPSRLLCRRDQFVSGAVCASGRVLGIPEVTIPRPFAGTRLGYPPTDSVCGGGCQGRLGGDRALPREVFESSHRTGEAVRGRLRSVTSRLTCSNRL